MQHDDFKANKEFIELHVVKRYFHVTKEGDLDQLFDDPGSGHAGEEAPAQVPLAAVVDDSINGQSEEANTIKALHEVIDIDDDNEPAPKNVPRTMDSSNQMLSTEWGHTGFCYRKSQNLGDSWARLNFPVDPTTNGYYVQLFKRLFPKQVLTVVIDNVNENMNGEDDLTYGEFLWWIGIWVLMLTVDGANCHSFWLSNNVDPFEGALQILRHDQQSQLFLDASYLNGGNLYDNELGQLCVLFPSHSNDCQCPNCSHILLEQAKTGCFAMSSTNCKALDI